MPRRCLIAASGLCLALACAQLPELSLGECGNGVLEAGEDCDLHADPALGPGTACGPGDGGARACRYVCGGTGAASCPSGWACAADGLCRHSTGTFVEAPGSPWLLEGPSLALADFDGNGDLDVLAASRQGISVRYGASPGEFGRATSLALSPTGFPSSADLDADGNEDVVMAVGAGLLVLRGKGDQTLAPVAYSPFEFSGLSDDLVLTPLALYPAFHQSVLIYVMDVEGGSLLFFNSGEDPVLLPSGHRSTDLAGTIPTGNLDPPEGLWDMDEFVLPFAGDDQLYLYEVRPLLSGALQPALRDTLQLPGPLLHGAFIADLDGDGVLDLLVSIDDGTAAGRMAVALGDGAGAFAAFAFDRRFDRLGPGACDDPGWTGEHRWPLAVGALGGDSGLDLVTAEGVVYDVGLSFCPMGADAGAPWREAAIADFDADGFLDLALAGPDEAVDYRFGEGRLLYTYRRVALRGLPAKLRAGDYDGDGIADLALVARGGEAGDTVEVLYSEARGFPGGAVKMGSFPSIHELLRLGANTDRPDDLLLISTAEPFGAGARAAGLLYGTPDRYLVSPFSLSDPVTGQEDTPVAVVAGRFDPGGDSIPDLLALAPPNLWLLPGAGEARFEASTARAFPIPPEVAGFHAKGALLAVADLDGDGLDEVVGIDAGEEGAGSSLLIVRAGTEESPAPSLALTPLPDGLRGPHRLLIRDVDGDGAPDVLVAFAGVAEPLEGNLRTGALVLLGGGGTPGDRGTIRIVAPQSAGRIWSIDALDADGEPALELAVLTELGVHVVELDGSDELTLPAAPALELSLEGGQVRTLDLDHDGLDDLLLDDGQALRSFLATPHVSR